MQGQHADLLQTLKHDPALGRIPIVGLTRAGAVDDTALTTGADHILTKPVELRQFMRVIGSIDSFYMSIVKLSPRLAEAG